MRIADLTVAVRPRNPYEAMDLGVRLTQSEWPRLLRVWLAVAGPVLALAALLTLASGQVLWGWLLLWWLKPVYDMALLLLLSRRVFGATPTWRELQSLLAGALRMGLVGHLLWRRLSLSRAYRLPVWVLEQLPAAERAPRLTLLSRQQHGKAQWLHVVMAHIDGVLQLALLSLVYWLLPEAARDDFWTVLTGEPQMAGELLKLGVAFLAMMVVEPFYVAMGFMLYLNRRTALEAWDLELAFRHLAARLPLREAA